LIFLCLRVSVVYNASVPSHVGLLERTVDLHRWTSLDLVFVLIIALSTGLAVTKGLAREIVSLVALIGGLLLAAIFYRTPALWFVDFSRSETVAQLLGFLIIFLGCLTAGAVVSFIVNKFVKMAKLQWMDRILGGVFGFLRGWAIASIIVLALIAFPVRPDAVPRSDLAPYLLAGARAAALIIPGDLKAKFYDQYKNVLQTWNQGRSSE
jgi:membrane protein required for colicin V production